MAKAGDQVLAETLAEVAGEVPAATVHTHVLEGHPAPHSFQPRTVRICWYSARGDTGDSPGPCSARSTSTACNTRPARSSLSADHTGEPTVVNACAQRPAAGRLIPSRRVAG
jgi:hypothetical protein